MTKNTKLPWVEYLLLVGFVVGLTVATTEDVPPWVRVAGFALIGACLRPLIVVVARREVGSR